MPDKLTNQAENKIAPPVELTDEEMEQASGGTDAGGKAQQWKDAAAAHGRTYGPYPHNGKYKVSAATKDDDMKCYAHAIFGANAFFVPGSTDFWVQKAKCYNCDWEYETYVYENCTF